MKEKKKLLRKFRSGTVAGVFALALVFALAACGGDDNSSPGPGGPGNTLGPSALGDTLLIQGAQVYNHDMYIAYGHDQYETYNGGDIDFTMTTSQYGGNNIGGKVIIADGKLDFTADPVGANNLSNVKAEDKNDYDSLEYELSRMSPFSYYGLDYTNLTITGSDWESAKWAELMSPLSRSVTDRSDRLTRESYIGYDNYSIDEEVTYIYVDKTITVTADGGEKTDSSSSGNEHYELKDFNITLEKGWNVLYLKRTDTDDTDTETFELIAGDPSNVYWLNEWD